MKISINTDGNIGDLQRQFNFFFPFLKLEFYETSDLKKGRSSKPALEPHTRMRNKSNDTELKELLMTDAMTVTELENKIHEVFGLNAEVLRKSGNVWLETKLTSNWTLLQQNKMGIAIS